MASDELEIPAGMNAKDFRNHDITHILSNAARGKVGLPDESDLDALNLPADARLKLRRECEKAAKVADAEDRESAERQARSAAIKLLDELPGGYRAPGPSTDDGPDETDPDKLAEMVRREFSPY